MRIVFFGTPELSVPFLEEAARDDELCAAVCQPDRPVGRSKALQPPPVKRAAQQRGLPVFQGRPSDHVQELQALKPDLFFVVAYGRILKPETLAIPRLGALNVHFSVLPRHRGAAPMQHALLSGDTETGVSLFWLDEGMDTGPVQEIRKIPLSLEDDAGALQRKLVELGLETSRSALRNIREGRIQRRAQPPEGTLAPKLEKAMAPVDFALPAIEVHNKIRGLALWPRAETVAGPRRLFLLQSSLGPDSEGKPPGTILKMDGKNGILIQCSSGTIWIRRVQPEGGKPMDAASFLRGASLEPGDRLGPVSNR